MILGALQWWNMVHTRWAHLPAVRIEHFEEDFPALAEELYELVPELPRRPGGLLYSAAWRRRKGDSGRWPRKTWDELHERYPEEAARARAITILHYGTDEVPA